VKRGNSFAIISSLKELSNGKDHKYSMHIGDTVYLDEENKVVNLTKEVSSNFDNIGYDFAENEKDRKDYELPSKPTVSSRVSRAM